jgi:hypothetical protein
MYLLRYQNIWPPSLTNAYSSTLSTCQQLTLLTGEPKLGNPSFSGEGYRSHLVKFQGREPALKSFNLAYVTTFRVCQTLDLGFNLEALVL